uniref:Uncharacterized protein n=1 Tax=Siphoviridae sp. ctOCb13 TaxID=2825477 RepID=A0A8S5Q214_9CAUD|nr:MAG TPA: hypothetical protein [Siphoviridae sp. ctOCb13]
MPAVKPIQLIKLYNNGNIRLLHLQAPSSLQHIALMIKLLLLP